MKNKAHIAESSGDKKAFDVCVMNPPYDRNLHLKILEKVIPHCEETINISPCTEIKKYALYGIKPSINIKHYKIQEIIDVERASKFFGINIRQELGIIKFSSSANTNLDELREIFIGKYKSIYEKILKKAKEDNLKEHLDKTIKSKYFLKIAQGVTLYGNGKITSATFSPVALTYKNATKDNAKGHICYLNLENENQTENVWKLLRTKFYRWLNWKIELGLARYDETPYLDPNKEWNLDELYNFFNLTKDEIEIIENDYNEIP